MKAVLVSEPGGADQLRIGEHPVPQLQPDQILVKVEATALNRADIMQREGKYPPPPGASSVLGLEMAGWVAATGARVSRWKEGDAVFGLLPGGGYAQYAAIHQDMAMAIPGHFNMEEAAAIPEVFLTAFQALKWLGKVNAGEQVLIHAGASGVGTAAIQLAREMRAGVLVTASKAKHKICLDLGAVRAIDYQAGPFQAVVEEMTGGRGVDVIIDFIGGAYFTQNIACLARDGRLIQLATLGGGKAGEVDIRQILAKRLTIIGSTLRSRTLAYQISLTKDFATFALPLLHQGQIKPIIDKIFPWEDVAEAHRYMESNQNRGKIVLKVD
jgi:tumor protein p53-inducible protein 3